MESELVSQVELSNALKCQVQAITLEPLQTTPQGYMADIYRMSVKTEQGQRSLIMKVASSNPERREIAERFDSYRNEQRFYSELNHDLPFRVPVCHLNADDRFLLILEDLGEQGAVETIEGASESQATDALQTLAKIHGHFLQNKPAIRQGIRSGLLAAGADMQSFVLQSLRSERLVGPKCPAIQLAEHYASNSADYVPIFEQQDQVFTHLDFRLDNLRFLEQLVVLDWGESTHAPVGFDIAGFLVTSLKTEDRRCWESDLLALYGETLKSFDIPYDPARVSDSYKQALLPTLYLPGLVSSHGDINEGQRLFERNLSAIEDHLTYLEHTFYS